ncbi:MAG: hypothetical protein ABIQ44_02400 [Chloroflexia bacterium]
MKRLLVSIAAVLTLVLVACGPTGQRANQPDEPTPTPVDALPELPTTTPTAANVEPIPTTSMPGMPANLCAQLPNVISFDVWQDFMPGPKSGNPLRASLIVELVCPTNITIADISGSITIKRKSGEEIIATPLKLDSMVDTATANVKQLSLTIRPEPPTVTLTEGELVSGTATLTIGQAQVDIPLPETELTFTH